MKRSFYPNVTALTENTGFPTWRRLRQSLIATRGGGAATRPAQACGTCPIRDAVDEGDHRIRLRLQPGAIEAEENVGAGERHALVAVDEGMVHREAFPERRGLLDQVGVVAALRTRQGRGKQAGIADAGRPAEQAQLLGMDEPRVGRREIDHRLFGQRLVDLRPALNAFGVKFLDRRVDLARRSFGEAAKLVRG